MDLVMFIVVLAAVGGLGYWLYSTGKGPFKDD